MRKKAEKEIKKFFKPPILTINAISEM